MLFVYKHLPSWSSSVVFCVVLEQYSSMKSNQHFKDFLSDIGSQSKHCFICRQKKDEEKEKSLQDQLVQFTLDESRESLEFPSTLNSHDRLLVHEVSANIQF